MRNASLIALALFSATGCGKSEAKKLEEVRACSAITMDARGAANCLELQYEWDKDEARTAAQRFERERDSIARLTADANWRINAARHAKEIDQCAADPSGDMVRCLLGYGWAEPRAKATEDSVWVANASKHRDEIQRCAGRRDMQAGACLQLYYKWKPERALGVDDSIRRAKLR